MKIAFTTKEPSWDSTIDPRFGRTSWFLIYDEERKEETFVDNRDVENEAHGAGPRTARRLFESDPDILITGNGPGGNAASILEKAGITTYKAKDGMTVMEAYKAYKENSLTEL